MPIAPPPQVRLTLRLMAASPALPPSVVRFHARALRLAIARADHFTLRSAAEPRQLAADGPAVDFLFIDSSHEREATIDEWRAWRPRLAGGALVVFHDCDHPDFPGVAQAIAELGLVGRRCDGMFVWEAPADGWLPE